jgi:hypothetical protein
MVDFDLVFGFIFQKAVLKSRDHIFDTLHAWATIFCIYPAPNIETRLLDFFYDLNDPHKISKKIFFYDHHLQIQQKCIILADGFIVLELSSKYANSSFSEKDLLLFFSFQFINV